MPPRIPEPSLEQAHIRQLIPHAGRMCLLERATFWDETRIRCEATSHLDPGNPMRGEGGLRAVTGIEYAAQAIALHGALRAGKERSDKIRRLITKSQNPNPK